MSVTNSNSDCTLKSHLEQPNSTNCWFTRQIEAKRLSSRLAWTQWHLLRINALVLERGITVTHVAVQTHIKWENTRHIISKLACSKSGNFIKIALRFTVVITKHFYKVPTHRSSALLWRTKNRKLFSFPPLANTVPWATNNLVFTQSHKTDNGNYLYLGGQIIYGLRNFRIITIVPKSETILNKQSHKVETICDEQQHTYWTHQHQLDLQCNWHTMQEW